MNRDELKTLLHVFHEADNATNEAHAALCNARGTPEELDADLAYRRSLRAYAKAKVDYDKSVDEFLAVNPLQGGA